MIPYDTETEEQQQQQFQHAIQLKTIDDCLKRLVAAYARIDILQGFESKAAILEKELEKAVQENASLHSAALQQVLPCTRNCAVQTVAGSSAAAANDDDDDFDFHSGTAAALSTSYHHATSLMRDEVVSVVTAACVAVQNMQHDCINAQDKISFLEQCSSNMARMLEEQKQHYSQQLLQQERQHQLQVAALSARLLPSSSADAEASEAILKQECCFLKTALEEETGVTCSIICEVV
jgi:hypothetical protein